MPEKESAKKGGENELKSIEEICSSTWEPLYRFVYYKVQNREEAEEITQETYVKILSQIEKNKIKPNNYLGFLKTVSLNILRDRWRKRKRQGVHINPGEFNIVEFNLENSVLDPEQRYVQQELIRNALEMLRDEQRKVIELRIIKGYSVAETGKIMNKKEGAIRVLQYRALQALAKILKEVKEV